MGFARNAKGLPTGAPINGRSGWDEKAGLRPRGRLTGMSIDHAGRLLVVEDFNRSLLMLMSDTGGAPKSR